MKWGHTKSEGLRGLAELLKKARDEALAQAAADRERVKELKRGTVAAAR